MNRINPMLGAALLLTACAATPSHHLPGPTLELPNGGATVPLHDFGGRPVVDVTIAGQGPFAAIVDTGASGSVIDAELAAQLQLPKAEGLETPQEPDGSGGLELVELTDASIGAAKAHRLLAAVEPLAKFMRRPDAPKLILSAEAFPGYLLTLDFPARTATLRKGALPAANERDVFEYAEADVLPMVPVKVGTAGKRVHLDTGSPKGLTLPLAYMKQVPLKSEPVLFGKARTHGGEFDMYRATLDRPVEVGELKLAVPEIVFSDVRPGGDVATSEPPGNLGSAALATLAVTVDAANRRIQLRGASAP